MIRCPESGLRVSATFQCQCWSKRLGTGPQQTCVAIVYRDLQQRKKKDIHQRCSFGRKAKATSNPRSVPPTQVDIEALGQALQVVEQKNLEYMNRIHKQEQKGVDLGVWCRAWQPGGLRFFVVFSKYVC